MTPQRQGALRGACPSCGSKGRPVKPITVESLVTEKARARAGRSDGFRFCPEPSCDVAYFQPESGDRFLRTDVRVPIGQKETTPPRTVCYCFDHTVEEIETDVVRTGTSRIPDEIAGKCRQGLDRCEETNPQGACCLGNVRRVLKEAQARAERGTPGSVGVTHESKELQEDCCTTNPERRPHSVSRLNAGVIAQIGALISAVVASACCWLPLLLLAVGISGGALSATFEAWRPVLLPVTFALLGVAFYFSYRKPKVLASALAGGTSGDACCSVPEPGVTEPCCPAENAKGITLKKMNKVMLWLVTAMVLAFAFFPDYVGYLLSAGDDLDKILVKIEGMTCEACAANIENSLRKVPGVEAAKVNYDKSEALVGVPRGDKVPQAGILSAIAGAGNYIGKFADQIQWTLAIEGMTCEGCATGLQVALSRVPGVTSASVSYDQRQARITAGLSMSEETLRKVVSEAGYTLRSISRK